MKVSLHNSKANLKAANLPEKRKCMKLLSAIMSLCCVFVLMLPSFVFAEEDVDAVTYYPEDEILPKEFMDYDTIDYSGADGGSRFDVIVEGDAGTFRAQGKVIRVPYVGDGIGEKRDWEEKPVSYVDEDGRTQEKNAAITIELSDIHVSCMPEEMLDKYIEETIEWEYDGLRPQQISKPIIDGKPAVKMVWETKGIDEYGDYYWHNWEAKYIIEIDSDIVAGVRCYLVPRYTLQASAPTGLSQATCASMCQDYISKWSGKADSEVAKTLNQPFSYEITTTIESKGILETLLGGESGEESGEKSGDVSGEVSGKESGEVSGRKSKDKVSGEESGEVSGDETKDKISGEESGEVSGDETKDKISGEESGNASGEISGDGDETSGSAQAKKNEATNGGAATAAATGAAGGILGGIGAAGALGNAGNPTPPMPGDGGMTPGQPSGNQGQPGNRQDEPQPNQNNVNNENLNALSEEERKRREAAERQNQEQQNANNKQAGRQQGNLTDKQKQQIHQLEVAEKLGAKDVEEAKKILKQIQKENLKTRSLAYAGSAAIGFVYKGTGIIKSGADLGATYVKTAGDLAKPGMGTAFKTSYTMLTEEFGGMAESYANKESIWKGLARGITKGTTNVVQDMATSPKQIIYTRVVGETVKSIADNVGKGNSYWTITTEAAKAAGKGIVHAGVDIVVGTAGKIAKETTKTAAKTIDIACGMTSDIVKGLGNLYDYITGA